MTAKELKEYRARNRYCELLPYFVVGAGIPSAFRRIQTARVEFGNGYAEAVPFPQPAGELHHVLGSSNGCARADELTNIIHVCNPVHRWLEEHKRAGLVLCCWHKQAKGEMDWDVMREIKGTVFPSCFDTDDFGKCCEPFPFVERMRREMIE